MINTERFEGLNMKFNQFEEEARCRWGNPPINNMNLKLNRLSKKKHHDSSLKWDFIA